MAQSAQVMTRTALTVSEASTERSTPAREGALRDAELVARIRAGDRAAEASLYRAHVHAVTALSMRLLGSTGDAEDVVQDSFVSALSRLHQLRDAGTFRAWLLRITVRHVHRRFRRRKLLRLLGLEVGQSDVSLESLASPALSADGRAELSRLDQVLSTLPTRQRVAWMLRHVEGQELAEVASACEASLATVKRWIALAEARIHQHVQLEAP